jgi:predicted lipoprotein with Yx(FWY)xxD motif
VAAPPLGIDLQIPAGLNHASAACVPQVMESVFQGGRIRQLASPHPGPRAWLRVAGSGLLLATGAIHLDLYLTGYRTIPTIGWLFLLQVITAFVLAGAVAATGHLLAAAAGAGFALATLGGYLLSIWVSLFGFREVRTTAGIVAGLIEVAAFLVLAWLAAIQAGRERWVAALPGWRRGAATASTAIGGLAAIALILLGVAVAGAGQPAPVKAGPTAVLMTTMLNGARVLTNSRGFTLYWFAPDTPTSSRCTGSCAQYWPPVTGRPQAGPGVTGRLGEISRPGGEVQATFDGHPLYTYIGDSGPGQAHGNGLNLNGGLWHEVTVPG